jgi:hypothetical protein
MTLALVGRESAASFILQLVGDVRSVQQGSPAKESILAKSCCLLWMTLTLVGASQQ